MNAIRLQPGLGVGFVLLAFAGQAWAFQTASVARDKAMSAQGMAAACSSAAIAEVAGRKRAPAVIGCRYDAVATPLLSAHILALPTPVYSAAASGLIVAQTPAAGTVAKTNLLLVQVSKGPQPQPQPQPGTTTVTQVSSSEAPATSSSSSSSVVSSSESKAPKSPPGVASNSASSAESLPAPPSSASSSSASSLPASSLSASSPDDGPGFGDAVETLRDAIAAYPLPAVIAVGIAALLAALGLTRRTPKIGVVPRVRADIEPGPSRLILKGPLVLGRKGDAQ